MTVSSLLTPTVSIATNPGTSVCAGTKVTFTATITNGGTTPVYQWKKNGINVGTNTNNYIVDTALKNNDSVYCLITSNAACATPVTVQSNIIRMTVNSPVTPIVSITANLGANVCTGNKVIFTATATNGGASPGYQWKKNGVNVGTNSNIFNDSTLKNGDSIYCTLASNAPCATASIVNSNAIKMTVNNPIAPTISIAVSPGTSVCAGTIVTFTATITNGGTAPAFQWMKNGINISGNKTFVDTAVKNGDSIYCIITSNAACATSTAKSNGIKMTVNSLITPTVSIATSPGTSVCAGTKVTFTATITNGGTTPVYQWKKNGVNVGTNSNTYVIDTALKNNDSIYCALTSNAACVASTAKSNGVKMTVNPPVTPTVSIAATPGAAICTGSKVTLTATVINGGASPIYQWKKNNVNVGTNSKTYIDSTLKTGDSIYCTLAGNAPCAITGIVNSNGIKMTVSNPVTPAISIAVSPGTSICAGSSVTFTATATNGGTAPVYQWKKNGINIGTNSKTYVVDTALKNNDSIYCVFTSNAGCATSTAKSNGIKMTVNNSVSPTVSITASPGTSICTGTKVTFTATITNGGTTPAYQWKKNGNNVGTNSNTYVVDTALKNNDSIYCVVTSNAICATTSTAKSNGIKMTVNSPVTPSVSIAVSPGTSVCGGAKVTFTATATNGGTAPVYQWKKNGITVGTNSSTYIVDTALKNNDSIYCVLTSNAACATSAAKSNGIKMAVTQPVTPTLSIAVSPGTSVCAGSKVTFTATAANGGTTPVYQWKKNGVNVGTNSNVYVVDTALKNNDSIYCTLTSNAVCATISTVKSNQVKMTVNKPVTPTILIAASPSTSVCKGSKVTFTAAITNGGTSPVYQWKKNGINVGTNSSAYVIDTALKNGDSIYCVLTSNAACAAPAKSNGIKMIVNNCLRLTAGNNIQSSAMQEIKELSLTATPNPFSSEVRLTIISPVSVKAVVLITAMTGQTVFKQDVLLNRGTNMISVKSATWAAGTYYAQVGTNAEVKSYKILKQ
jgi:predicted deacylase